MGSWVQPTLPKSDFRVGILGVVPPN